MPQLAWISLGFRLLSPNFGLEILNARVLVSTCKALFLDLFLGERGGGIAFFFCYAKAGARLEVQAY